jgi:hypothetical protein
MGLFNVLFGLIFMCEICVCVFFLHNVYVIPVDPCWLMANQLKMSSVGWMSFL